MLAISVQDYLPGPGARLFNVALVAPVVEELAKAMALVIVFWFARKEFDGVMDGLLYGSLAGFGFAMTENVFYFQRAFHEGFGMGIQLTFMRAVVFGMNHALFCSMFGLGLGIARYSNGYLLRVGAPIAGLCGGVLLHMFHNFAVSSEVIPLMMALFVSWAGVGMWLLLVFNALKQESAWIREELADEVSAGLLTEHEVLATANVPMRARLRLGALRIRRNKYAQLLGRLYALAADLAFKKRLYRIRGDEDETLAEIERLRKAISDWRTETN